MSNEKALFYDQPPSYQQPEVAAAGNRIPASTEQEFDMGLFGPAAAQDLGGQPIWVVSALLKDSVQPGKLAPHLGKDACRYPFAGGERVHQGRFDVLPVTGQ
jgi:hypothetical protein